MPLSDPEYCPVSHKSRLSLARGVARGLWFWAIYVFAFFYLPMKRVTAKSLSRGAALGHSTNTLPLIGQRCTAACGLDSMLFVHLKTPAPDLGWVQRALPWGRSGAACSGEQANKKTPRSFPRGVLFLLQEIPDHVGDGRLQVGCPSY